MFLIINNILTESLWMLLRQKPTEHMLDDQADDARSAHSIGMIRPCFPEGEGYEKRKGNINIVSLKEKDVRNSETS